VKVLEFFRFSRNFATISRISPKIPPKFWKLSNFSSIFTTISPYFHLIQRIFLRKSIDIDLHSLSEEICHWLSNFQLRSSIIVLGNVTHIFHLHVSSWEKAEIFNFVSLPTLFSWLKFPTSISLWKLHFQNFNFNYLPMVSPKRSNISAF
jgi:hypothetical protein